MIYTEKLNNFQERTLSERSQTQMTQMSLILRKNKGKANLLLEEG